MASIFTRIIEGDLPARFVWRDDRVVAFLDAFPVKPGHTLVVPVQEVDDWLDLDPDLSAHVFEVARTIGRALLQAFGTKKVALVVLGLEVPHAHLHLAPIDSELEVDPRRRDMNPDPAMMDDAAERIRAALRELGAEHVAG